VIFLRQCTALGAARDADSVAERRLTAAKMTSGKRQSDAARAGLALSVRQCTALGAPRGNGAIAQR